MNNEPIGFLPCRACNTVKSVFQGKGRNAQFLYAKCECGTDTRKGAPVQRKLAQHVPLEEAQAALIERESQDEPNQPLPEPEPNAEPPQQDEQTPPPKDKPSSFLGWGVFALVVGSAVVFKRVAGGAA